ncbi:MAG: SusC/RagA family TonB-linked outer membrane protein [Gemmatimonadota bacterium]
MAKLKVFAAVLAVLLIPAALVAQQEGSVGGTVLAEDTNEPLQGVQVVLRGTNQGTLTNESGRFLLQGVPAGEQTLQFMFIGYATVSETVTVQPGAVATLYVRLPTDVLGLDEIVVVGYGQERRRNVTGAISSVQPADIAEDIPAPNVENILQGRVAGVQVVQNSGNPGSAMTIRVRGTASISAGNQPLYVVDGVPMIQGNYSMLDGLYGGQGVDALADLNPNEIESIEVLKDASAAAIYGSRASNGVVLITTKQGVVADRPRVEYNAYYGVQEAWRVPEFTNAREYMDVTNEGYANYLALFGLSYADYGADAFFSYDDDDVVSFYEIPAGTDTDWLNTILEPAPVSNMSGSIAGGTEKARYFISGTWFNQDGLVQGFGYDRLNSRLNLDYSVTDDLTLGTNVALTRGVTKRLPGDNNIYGPFANSIANPPIEPIYADEENEEFNFNTSYSNPVAIAEENEGEEKNVRVLGNAFANWELMGGVQGRVSVGVDHYSLRSKMYDSPVVGSATGSRGQAYVGNSFANKLITEGTVNWLKDVAPDHSFSGVVGASYEQNETETNWVTGTTFPSTRFRLLTSAASITGGSGSLTDWYLLSFFGRASYTFADRITGTFNVRTDGSSRFGENNRFGVFPSGSLLWRVTDEEWMQDQELLSDLALRVSYGRTGNQQGIGNFASWGLVGTGYNYMDTPGSAPSQLANPDLSWEKTTQLNMGADLAFLDGRLGLTADYYVKNTTDLLLNRLVPYTSGFNSITENIGAVENRGVELGLQAQLVQGDARGFNWTAELNVSANRNEVTELYNDEPINSGFASRVEVGEPLGAFYGYVTDGLFQSSDEICMDPSGESCAEGTAYQSQYTRPGDIRFRDLNGDGVITTDDRDIIGNPWPDFQGGLTNTMSWGGFDLSAFLQFSQGNEIYNGTRTYTDQFGGYFDNNSARALDRWTPENTDTDQPRAIWYDMPNNSRTSDRFIEDGSYTRLKNLVLGYTLPESVTEGFGFNQLRVYVQGQNLVTWTDYSGFDPEVNYAGDTDVTRGTDFYTLPQARTLSFGVDIGL